jgi:hypothetical protein
MVWCSQRYDHTEVEGGDDKDKGEERVDEVPWQQQMPQTPQARVFGATDARRHADTQATVGQPHPACPLAAFTCSQWLRSNT